MKVGTVVLLAIAIAVTLTYFWHRSSKPKYPTYPKIDGVPGFQPQKAAPAPSAQENLDWQLDQLLRENPYLQQNQRTSWSSYLSFAAMTGLVLLLGALATGKDPTEVQQKTNSSGERNERPEDGTEERIDKPVHPQWPGNAHLAVCVSLILDDADYGLRFGIWALLEQLREKGVPATVFTTPQILARSPTAVAKLKEAGCEISLLFRVPDSKSLSLKSSAPDAHSVQACLADAAALETLTATPPAGLLLQGAGLRLQRAIMAAGQFQYDATPSGDLPFLHPHLVVPSAPVTAGSISDQLQRYKTVSSDGLQHGLAAFFGSCPSLHAPTFGCSAASKLEVGLEMLLLSNRAEVQKVWYCTRKDVATHCG